MAGSVKSNFQVGHIAFGTNRHLINSLASRGLMLTVPIQRRLDFSFAAMNGTSIVGFENFFGFNRREHQILSGTLGFEFFPQRPGGLRVEAALLKGSVSPLNNFNQGSITDAEKSRGDGFRLLASDPSQRFRLEGGWTASTFTNPADPLLAQGNATVAVRETERHARYLEVSGNILRNLVLSPAKNINLTANFRHEKVDPLFRSVTAFTQADRLQNQFELIGNLGEITVNLSHTRFHDNLDKIPSLLRTRTRRNTLNLGVPLAPLPSNPARPSAWLPSLSYNVDWTHQFGESIPSGGGFEDVSFVPDQISINHFVAANWQGQRWRLGYRFNHSLQDNRQPGRERADLKNIVNGLTLGVTVSTLDLNFDVNVENANNLEINRRDRTLRVGSNATWRMASQSTLAANFSTAAAGDKNKISESRNTEFDVQWSQSFGWAIGFQKKLQGQFFIRLANRFARAEDKVFGFNNRTQSRTGSAGMSINF